MNLALAIFRMFPDGGLQRDFLGIAERLRDAGHTVQALVTAWEGRTPDGVSIHTLPAPGLTNHGGMAAFARAIDRWRRNQRPDALVAFNRLPGADIHFCGDISFIAASRRHGWAYRLTPRYRTFAALERAVFGPDSATQILVLSERTARDYRTVHGTPAERLHLLPPAIDPRRRRPADAPARRTRFRAVLGVDPDVPLVLSIGARLGTKGVDRTLAALAMQGQGAGSVAHFAVIGRGDTHAIGRRAARLGLGHRVHVLGPRPDIPDALCAADLLAHPARRENTGGVILEAVVAGLPVLATEVCGFAEHVLRADAGAVLSEPFDVRRYADSLARMLTSPLRQRWSANGVAYGQTQDLYGGLDVAARRIEALAGHGR